MTDDPRLSEAQAIPIGEIADRLGLSDLRRDGRERVGPCPVCGGRDRFSVAPDRGVYNCRNCGGGDGIGLVRHVLSCGFREALGWLVGEAEVTLSPEEAARRERDRAQRAQEREATAARARARAVQAARDIWAQGRDPRSTEVEAYLAMRGIRAEWLGGRLPASIRFHCELPYMVAGDTAQGWREVHRGPAMLAAVTDHENRVRGVHRTWLDLDQPKGKARILAGGEALAAKKTLGSVKGGAIRLAGDRAAPVMVMGEGIETTLTARVASEMPARFWAGVSLGNMAGRRLLTGAGMKYAGVPDLEDAEAFVPPEGVRELIFIQDGDSEPRATRAKLLAGLRRAKARVPGLERIAIVHAGEGMDLNDVLMRAREGEMS